ncbi:MAG: OmpH family outer membrane protein [Rhodobacteraceae bacterium]|nr:OmpH family outer membrane protein [Paracoccaceae bacterium]
MRATPLFAALLAAALAAGAPIAQDRPAVQSPILTIDQDELFERSAFGSRVRAEITAASADLAAENRRLEAELAEEEKRLTALRQTTDPQEFARMAAEFDARVVEVRRTQDQKARDLSRRPEEARQEFFRAAVPVLADLVRERGALAILDTRAVIISADVIDITEEAIRRLDATLGDGTGGATPPEATEAPDQGRPAPAPP